MLNVKNLKKGMFLDCKYPMHGTKNILKCYFGRVEQTGVGPNGPYAKVRCGRNTIRTFRFDRIVEPTCS